VSAGSAGVVAGEFLVAVNVRSGDLDQLFLMPPSVKDWLPEDHLAFFVLDVVSISSRSRDPHTAHDLSASQSDHSAANRSR
jgi:hypothetical protein